MRQEQIQPGKKYLLVPKYTILRTTLIREVLRIENGEVIVHSLSGREVAIPLGEFAALAREEVVTTQ